MTVEELLKSQDVYFMPKGRDYVISCLNPDHPDKNPSMRVDQITGIFNCFSCQYKGNIFKYFGQKPNALEIRRETLKRKIQAVRASTVGLPLPRGAVPYTGNWRGIHTETYQKFEAFLSEYSEKGQRNVFSGRIVFPIKDISGDIVGFVGRHTGDGTPKYLNQPAGVKLPLYPQVTPLQSTVMLVEGIYDMLNLHDKGLDNVMCCFGVKGVTKEKLSILQMQGVQRIDIFLDNDDAGQQGSSEIMKLCDELGLEHRNIRFGSKETDPGSLSERQVQGLKKKLYT